MLSIMAAASPCTWGPISCVPGVPDNLCSQSSHSGRYRNSDHCSSSIHHYTLAAFLPSRLQSFLRRRLGPLGGFSTNQALGSKQQIFKICIDFIFCVFYLWQTVKDDSVQNWVISTHPVVNWSCPVSPVVGRFKPQTTALNTKPENKYIGVVLYQAFKYSHFLTILLLW